ncbi:Uncharacterised protein [Yersinia enterocolitica]|nr:Uncharacterised protein [Yersinia mollaretii]CNK37182.1 Uncharacterised protein [Yersinia enterocolitica]CQQ77039.1 Uncharacterised protein [Yersinia mollaretii]
MFKRLDNITLYIPLFYLLPVYAWWKFTFVFI